MIDIAISGLVKEFEVGKKILDGLTFQVDSGERVGLLGKNGCGKTTLLRILTGQLDWDEGEVVLAPDKRVGLISQIPVYPAGYTVEDVLDTAFRPPAGDGGGDGAAGRPDGAGGGPRPAAPVRRNSPPPSRPGGGYDTDTRKNKVCSGLQIGPGMREQLFDRLSGGEKTRVNLGRLILEDTDILLLDEPTNHLDLKATEWLEEYLRTSSRAPCWRSPTTAGSWTGWCTGSSRSRTARRSSTPAITASTWRRRSAATRRS